MSVLANINSFGLFVAILCRVIVDFLGLRELALLDILLVDKWSVRGVRVFDLTAWLE